MSPRAGAIAVVFVANGVGGPSFLARLPDRQDALHLSDGALGLTIAGMALGALVASPTAGRAVGAVGSRRVVLASAVALGASMWLTGVAPSAPLLFGALALVGAADAAMDISMNANGAAYEKRTGRSILHRLHAAWSLGALAAAALAGVAASRGVSLTTHLAVVGGVLTLATLLVRRGLVPDDARAPGAPSTSSAPDRIGVDAAVPAVSAPPAVPDPDGAARPSLRGRPADGDRSKDGGRTARRWGGPLIVLGLATVGGAMIEGGSSDWAAVQLERYGASAGVAAGGVAAFMTGMVTGRLAGDHLAERWGERRLLRTGMVLAAAGLTAGALAGHPAVFVAGLLLAGAGASGFFPLAFSAASRTPGVAPGVGAATVSLAARIGFLLEPPLIGVLAELLALRWVFVLVAGVAATMALAAARIVPDRAAATPH